jgi:hypothetical protein
VRRLEEGGGGNARLQGPKKDTIRKEKSQIKAEFSKKVCQNNSKEKTVFTPILIKSPKIGQSIYSWQRFILKGQMATLVRGIGPLMSAVIH